MVKKWMKMIGREIRGLHEAAYLLAVFAFISLVLALVRDKLLAYSFGAGNILDLYYAAFRIPDLIFVSIGSLVSASILLPFFIDRFGKGESDGRTFFDSMFTVFFGLMVITAGAAYFLAPYLVPIVMPGFKLAAEQHILVETTRIMLLSPFFLGLSNLFSSLTQMRHRFLVYAASPVVYNLAIILGVLFLYPIFGIQGMALGVGIGAFLHMLIQVPFMASEKLLPRFTAAIEWKSLKRIILTSFPRTLTLSANQLASFVLVSLASLMSVGSISVFNFAFNLQSVPLSLIGASYSSAVFPTLSRLYYEKNIPEYLEKMIAAARHIIFWSMPITILFTVLRAQVVRTVLGAGNFSWSDTRLTAAMLALFTLSTIGQSLIVLFVRGFYAEGKTTKPLMINVISASTIVVLGYLLDKAFFAFPVFRYFIEDLLKVGSQRGTSVLVLALAYSLGVLLNTVLHWWTFERAYKGFTRPVLSTLFHSFAASVIMGYASYLSLQIFAAVFPLTKVWGVFMQGFCAGIIGLIVLVITLRILENRELAEVWQTLHKKIWKASVPPPEVQNIS
ncbi:MAG TPA: lipid II flippase MurJ [Candidatus Paceibacterota bacterium]